MLHMYHMRAKVKGRGFLVLPNWQREVWFNRDREQWLGSGCLVDFKRHNEGSHLVVFSLFRWAPGGNEGFDFVSSHAP
jgi:hypothetical protein